MGFSQMQVFGGFHLSDEFFFSVDYRPVLYYARIVRKAAKVG